MGKTILDKLNLVHVAIVLLGLVFGAGAGWAVAQAKVNQIEARLDIHLDDIKPVLRQHQQMREEFAATRREADLSRQTMRDFRDDLNKLRDHIVSPK